MNAPILAGEIAALRQRREAENSAREQARAAAVARRPVRTVAGSSPIEKFNAAHLIEDLLTEYGYQQAPNGQDWRSIYQGSASYATRAFVEAGGEYWVSLSESDGTAGLGQRSASGATFGDAFDLFVHYEHGGDRDAALAERKGELAKLEAERRRAQREENAQIGAGPDAIPLTEILSVDDMLSRFTFIRDGSQVADLICPQAVISLADFRNAMAGSKHQVTNADGSTRSVPATKVWLESPDRMQADTLTFRAGAGFMTRCPHGRQALNIWRPHDHSEVPENWQCQAAAFVNHVVGLFGEDADAFLDWLAHIEQKPGELPHFGWLHISRLHGTGRNWIAGVLARLWTGNVAASLDLVGLLEGGFNDRLSRCVLAIVDEINEGGGSNVHRTSNRLRQLVTAEVREINPKYGRKRVEHNAARWLIFSNHTGALPLDEHDRRFWVVSHEGEPKEASYYVRLYALLRDPAFIASVGEFLRQRDISGFNPGQRPPMNAAKSALVDFSQSEDDAVCKALVANWPVDVITASELNGALPDYSEVTKPSVRHAMDRAGIRKLRKIRSGYGINIETCYALRNFAQWQGQDAEILKREIHRVTLAEKTRTLCF